MRAIISVIGKDTIGILAKVSFSDGKITTESLTGDLSDWEITINK